MDDHDILERFHNYIRASWDCKERHYCAPIVIENGMNGNYLKVGIKTFLT